MNDILKRLESLESAKFGARQPVLTPDQYGRRVYDVIWGSRHTRNGYGENGANIIPPEDHGYWPYLPEGFAEASYLRFSALKPIASALSDSVGNNAVCRHLVLAIAAMIDRDGLPTEPGGRDYFWNAGDVVPFVRVWFDESDLV